MPPYSESLDSQLSNKQARAQEKTRIACIGDSITELSGYPEYAKQKMGDNYIVGNFGACGTTVSLDSESPYMQSRAYASTKSFQPDAAIVMLGTNDANPSFSGSSFITDYLTLLDALKQHSSKPKIWVVKPPHVFDETWLNGHIMSLEVIPLIIEVAKQANLPLIDAYSVTDNPDLFFDGVHPNEVGAQIIAEVIYQAIL
jgi:acyl-CoA thioesterase I